MFHHFDRAWFAGRDWLKTVPLRDLTQKHPGGGASTSTCMKNVYKKTSSFAHSRRANVFGRCAV